MLGKRSLASALSAAQNAQLPPRTTAGTPAATFDAQPGDDEVTDALLNTRELATEIPLLAKVQREAPGIDILVDPRALTLDKDAGGNAAFDVDIAVAALSSAYRNLVARRDRVSRIIAAAELQRTYQNGLLLRVERPTHERAARLRVLVRDRSTGRIGTVDIPLDCCANVLH